MLMREREVRVEERGRREESRPGCRPRGKGPRARERRVGGDVLKRASTTAGKSVNWARARVRLRRRKPGRNTLLPKTELTPFFFTPFRAPRTLELLCWTFAAGCRAASLVDDHQWSPRGLNFGQGFGLILQIPLIPALYSLQKSNASPWSPERSLARETPLQLGPEGHAPLRRISSHIHAYCHVGNRRQIPTIYKSSGPELLVLPHLGRSHPSPFPLFKILLPLPRRQWTPLRVETNVSQPSQPAKDGGGALIDENRTRFSQYPGSKSTRPRHF